MGQGYKVIFAPQAGRDLEALVGYIARNERQLPGNFSYYQLKKKGAAVINVSENKTKLLGGHPNPANEGHRKTGQ